jgi:hypothetical protein
MINQYSSPKDIDREFWDDYSKAKYWLKKHTSSRKQTMKVMDDGGWDVFEGIKDYSFSEPIYYTSPTTGNRWLTYLTSKRKDGFKMFVRLILFCYTDKYMTVMLPITTAEVDDDGNYVSETATVNVYTAHLFQRMADPDRLGVDMSDRVKVMRNFAEFVGLGWSDTRPPRDGERNTQIMLRTPGSWIRGHTINVGKRIVNIYRTFYTDKSMTWKQIKDVKSFRKFADDNGVMIFK